MEEYIWVQHKVVGPTINLSDKRVSVKVNVEKRVLFALLITQVWLLNLVETQYLYSTIKCSELISNCPLSSDE